MRNLPENLPEEVYAEIGRLEVELYDARSDYFHTVAGVMLILGLISAAFWYFGRIGAYVYTGGPEVGIPALIFIPLSVHYYLDRDRKNRRSLDR